MTRKFLFLSLMVASFLMQSGRLRSAGHEVPAGSYLITAKYAGDALDASSTATGITVKVEQGSASASVADGEFIAGVGRKQLGNLAEAFAERARGQQRIFAFAQLVVIHVESE